MYSTRPNMRPITAAPPLADTRPKGRIGPIRLSCGFEWRQLTRLIARRQEYCEEMRTAAGRTAQAAGDWRSRRYRPALGRTKSRWASPGGIIERFLQSRSVWSAPACWRFAVPRSSPTLAVLSEHPGRRSREAFGVRWRVGGAALRWFRNFRVLGRAGRLTRQITGRSASDGCANRPRNSSLN
jgi:hypothetical protein